MIWSVLLIAGSAAASDIVVTVKISGGERPTASVAGKFTNAEQRRNSKNFSFLRSVAGTDGLGKRITRVDLTGSDGKRLNHKQLIDGEFLAEGDIAGWSYVMDLTPPASQNSAAHVSWISNDAGILMLADLLPQFENGGSDVSARITFEFSGSINRLPIPTINTSEMPVAASTFDVPDIDSAIFYIGSNWKKIDLNGNSNPADLIILDEWKFTPDEAADMVREIMNEYGLLFRAKPRQRPMIAIAKFPGNIQHGQWEAETRGRNVTIISSDMAFRTQSLQRLHEQLRHEIFHLWIPNGVNLSGNYDWFYEGFALYQSLKTAVGFNRIRFDDYLDTLSRAYSIANAGTNRTNLIEASTNRWSGSNTQIYARGMLVAFLADISMLQSSGGKSSVSIISREVYTKHSFPNPRTEGNDAVLAVMRSRPELVPIIDKYITGSETIEWTADLTAAGIEMTVESGRAVLQAVKKPRGRQKAILDKLGYNNWRKSAPKSK